MCHNADLVVRPDELPTLPVETVRDLLSRRRGLVNGVVVTGGEPTLQSELAPFLRQLRAEGYDVKIDTNGYRPDVLASLLEEGLVDCVAMDLKGPPEKVPLLAGRDDLDLAILERSIELLLGSSIAYEFRTTVVPGWLDEEDIEGIARWITGAELYVLQQFRPQNTLDPALTKAAPYSVERLEGMAERARRWVNQTAVRGVVRMEA
jgi:pyruvate formate lyase activating enzyme